VIAVIERAPSGVAYLVATKALAQALAAANAAASPRPAVQIAVADAHLVVWAGDGPLSVAARIPVEGPSAAATRVRGDILAELVGRLTGSPVSVSVDPVAGVTLAVEKFVGVVRPEALAAGEVAPLAPTFEAPPEPRVTLASAALSALLGAEYAIGRGSHVGAALSSLLLHSVEGGLRAVATDGVRLVVATGVRGDLGARVLIPRDAVAAIRRVLTAGDAHLHLQRDGRLLVLTDHARVLAQGVRAAFPEYERLLLPHASDDRPLVRADAAALAAAAKRLLAAGVKALTLTVEDEGTLLLTGDIATTGVRDVGRVSERVPYEVATGEALGQVVLYDAQRLAGLLSHLTGVVEWRLHGSRPSAFEAGDDLALLAPRKAL
jgi:DNA polymerase III sliding clamp (beta) subunit (PCNA family)